MADAEPAGAAPPATTCADGRIYLGPDAVASSLSPVALLDRFAASLPALSSAIHSPSRPHFPVGPASSLILVPSWSHYPLLPSIGVKVVTAFPANSALGLPSVHASYLLYEKMPQ